MPIPAERMLIDTDNTTQYIGVAPCGSLTTAAAWSIQKNILSALGAIEEVYWADGDRSCDNIWTDRTTLTYS